MSRLQIYGVKVAMLIGAAIVGGQAGLLVMFSALAAAWISTRRATVLTAEQLVLVDHRGRQLACLGSGIKELYSPLVRRLSSEGIERSPGLDLYYANGDKGATITLSAEREAVVVLYGRDGAPSIGLGLGPSA